MQVQVFDVQEWTERLARSETDVGGCPLLADRLSPEMLIVGILAGDRVVAAWPIWNATHIDGLWVDPEYHGNPGVLRPLVEAVSATLAANQVHTTYALLAEDDAAGQDMASRLGFARVPGILFRRETPA
jgi:ribosomal protein S18 acetylase RimI-like enzyme